MKESSFESLVDFATDDQIFRLIAEERGKYAARIPKKQRILLARILFLVNVKK